MEDSKKYFISLDNLDIEYLPRLKKYLQGNDCDKVPLWSVVNASNSFADEICEFELFSKDDKDTTTSEFDENNSTEQCYICDTQVPKAYMQAHCTGEKHRICASILRHALRRAAQHAECTPFAPTGLSAQPVSLTHSEGTYFCDHCALAVNVKNKDTHEKTKEHRVSVIHDRLLNGLLITYTDKGRVVADSRYEAEVSNESDDVSVEEDVSRDNNDDDVTTALPDNLEDINHNNDVNSLPAILETTFAADTSHAKKSDKDKESSDEEESDAESIVFIDNNVVDDNWAKLSSNLKRDQAELNYQGDATSFNEYEDIEIVTVSNGIVRVPAKNYHGISYKLTGGISCLICQKTIDDIEAHIQEPGHIELLSVPVADINCIRQISPLCHHCIICNELVQSIPLHKSSSPHQSKLLSLELTSKKQGLQKKLNGTFYCELCYCDLDKNGIEVHFNGKRHAWNLSRATFTADNRVLHYHFKRDEDKIECSICNIVVSAGETDAHIVSDGHENNYKRFLVTNHISKHNKTFYCDCCKQKFSRKKTNEIEHVQSIKHKTTVYKPTLSTPVDMNCIENFDCLDVATIKLLYLLETSNTAKRVTCKVCKQKFKNRSTPIKKHMKKLYHQYNIDALLYVNKIKNKLDGTYFCEVCWSTIDQTQEIDHINSIDHKINEQYFNVYLSWRQRGDDMSTAAVTPSENPTSCVNVRDSNNREINVKNALLACKSINDDIARVAMTPAENTSNKIGSCETTGNSKVQNNSKHDNNMNSYLSTIASNPHEVMCQICNIVINNVDCNIKEHLDKRRHKSNYEKFLDDNKKKEQHVACRENDGDTSRVAVSLEENPISNVKILDHNTVDKSKLELHYHLKKVKDEIVCSICNVGLCDVDKVAHIESDEHNNNYKTFLVENQITKHKKGFYCDACRYFLKKTMFETDHITNKIHIYNISVYKPKSSVPVDVNSIQDIEFLDFATAKLLYLLDSCDETDESETIRCKVCKVSMKRKAMQIKKHMSDQYHQFNIDALLCVNKIKIKLNGTYFCEVCRNALYDTKEIDHINSNDHKINVRSWKERGNDIAKAAVTPTENSTSNVNFTLNNIESGKRKKKKIDALQKISVEDLDKIRPIDGEKQFCECFSVHLVNDTVSEHVVKYNHAINEAKYIQKQKTSTSKLKNENIEKCASNCKKNVEIPNVTLISYKVNDYFKDGETSHANSSTTGSSEVKKDYIHDMNSYLSAVPSKPYEVMCQICNTVIPNTDTNIKGHLNGRRHKSNYESYLDDKKKLQLKTVKEKLLCDNVKVLVPVAKTDKNDIQKTEALVKAQSIFLQYAEDVLFCRCCNTEVRYTQQDVDLHLSGWRHKVKSSAMLAEHGLRVEKNKIYCDVCEVVLANFDGITHIDSSRHKTKASAKALHYVSLDKDVIAPAAESNETKFDNCKVSNINNETANREQKCVQDNLLKAKFDQKEGAKEAFCDVCEVYVINMSVHLNSNEHQLTVNHKENDDLTCKVCNLKVNKNDLKQHENGALHNNKFKIILSKNQISQKWDGVLYCHLCDLFFTPFSLIKHVENENHKRLMYRMVRL